MYAFVALTLALAGSVLASPTIEERATSGKFRLTVVGSENIDGWAVLEAHVAAGINAIEIQRPSAYQSELVQLSGPIKQINNGKAKLQSHKAAGEEFAFALPTNVPSGQVAQVYSQLGGGTYSWGVNDNDRLTADGSIHGFWACPTSVPGDGKPFTLWYGLGVSSVNLPSPKCESIKLKAVYQ